MKTIKHDKYEVVIEHKGIRKSFHPTQISHWTKPMLESQWKLND